MSDQRINLAQLRETYVENAHYGNGTGCRCCDLVDRDYLLALVEAVEAAHAYLSVPRKAEREEATGAIICDFRPQQKAQKVLDAALARFDFGERP